MHETKKLENFYHEMNCFINYFEKIVNLVNYDSKGKALIYTFLKKIISNVKSANILIKTNHLNEAKIVLRSALETIVLMAYLVEFPNKIEDYFDDIQIIKIKNNFIEYKMAYEGEVSDIDGHSICKEELRLFNEKAFHEFTISAKNKVLKGINQKTYTINESTFNAIDTYFKRFKPFFMQLEVMYKDLEKSNHKIGNKFSLREIFYYFYNLSSQVTHGSFYDWNTQMDVNKELEFLFHYIIKLTLFCKILLKDKINLNPTNETQILVGEMEKVNNNLEMLLYGKVLSHKYN